MRNLATGRFLSTAAAALLLAATLTASLANEPSSAASAKIDFARDIKPIFDAACVSCHGPKKAKGGLRLDARPLAFEGGVSGKSIEPGKAKQSLLLHRILGQGEEDQMPLDEDPLTEQQIALLTRWIDEGAIWPESAADANVKVVKHWSFVKPVRPAEPDVSNPTWVKNPIDRFVLARLDREKIKPSPEASKATLLRRASLDLIGLPPTVAELDAFLADASPDVYEKAVDRLLASKHYGERWGRHWLDAARYADSNGYSIDGPRSIWPYRDWVIDALNADMPFDQFALEQLAGDMLPGATAAQRIATGFHRNTQINEEGGIDPEQFRIESVFDRVATTGTVFLGLTVGCAQCHNHKFDPISHKEYFQLFAFFNSADEPKLNLSDPPDAEGRSPLADRIAAMQKRLDEYEKALPEKVAEWEKSLTDDARERLKPEVRAALEIDAGQREKKQRDAVANAFKAADSDYAERRRELAALKKRESEGVTTLVMRERDKPRPTHLFIKGDFTRPADPVTPGVPKVLHSLKVENPTRLDLARWIGDAENPLTARVVVNRIWQQYFGVGLVETENDFGTQGSAPSHPELLDWLATEFVRQNWSMKAMHRLVVTSAAYRQSSVVRPDLTAVNPYNKLLARQSRVRLEAEIVRDVALVASGLFSDKVGGPGVYPPQPDGVLSLGQVKRVWRESTGPDRYRRGMYTFLWRATPHPLLGVFDTPEATSSCTRRARSNTPLQSLTLLNDEAFMEFSQALAARVLRDEFPDDRARLARAFRLCTSRDAADGELSVLSKLLSEQLTSFERSPAEAAALLKNSPVTGLDPVRHAAWTVVARVMLNLDETITRE